MFLALALALGLVLSLAVTLVVEGRPSVTPYLVLPILVNFWFTPRMVRSARWPELDGRQRRELEEAIRAGRLPEDPVLPRSLRRNTPRVLNRVRRSGRDNAWVYGVVLAICALSALVLAVGDPHRMAARLLGLALLAGIVVACAPLGFGGTAGTSSSWRPPQRDWTTWTRPPLPVRSDECRDRQRPRSTRRAALGNAVGRSA